MDWQITPYVLGLAVSLIASLVAAALALRHRDRPGGTALGLTMLAVAQWCACYVIEANAVTIPLKVFWSQLAYIGTQAATPLLLHFALRLTHHDRWLTPQLSAVVWSVPTITLTLAFTNRWHGLVWRGFSFVDASQRILIYEHGIWFWAMVVHVYGLLAFSTALLGRSAVRMRHIYRKQSLVTLGALAIPWSINAVYLFAPDLLNHRDWTPVGFAATGVMLTWAFRELQLLDLMPIARDLVVENMQEGVVVLDAAGRVVDLNAAGRRLIGREDAVGQAASRLYARLTGLCEGPNDAAPVDTDLLFSIADSAPHRGELVTTHNRILEWQLTPLTKQPRHLAGHIVLLRDVTEQRAAERALQEINATLESQVYARTAEIRAAQERSDAILRSVTDAIMMTDHDLTIRYTNPAFTTITGYTPEESLGTSLANAVRGDIYERLLEARETGRAWGGEARIQHADGRMIDLAVNVVPVHDETGTTTGFVCTGQDIGRLTNLIRTRKGILDNISHQLRTPVTTLRLYAHLLRRTELSDEQTRNLTVIDQQTAWLQHIIEDILEMTSLEGGAAIGTWTTVPVANLVDLTLERYGSHLARADLSIETPSSSTNGLAVSGDEGRLVQALGEILSNAIQFTPPGGNIKVGISQGEIERQPAIGISVTDTGPGIPPEEQARVFDRFFRGRITDSGQIRGTGLGLSIASVIVHAHGGHIELESDEGGSTFRVWLPEA